MHNFNVDAKIIGVDVGPSITRFEVQPAPGVKVVKNVELSPNALTSKFAFADLTKDPQLAEMVALASVAPTETGEVETTVDAQTVAQQAVPEGMRVGRNDPCPCGSGKKYKQCHGKLG